MKEEKAHNVGPSGIDIAYQRFGDPASPPVFLNMGGRPQMISWSEEFCVKLVNCGLQLVRFDNRDTGLPTHRIEALWTEIADLIAELVLQVERGGSQ